MSLLSFLLPPSTSLVCGLCVLACKYEESDNIENLSTLQPCCVLIVES